MPQPRAPQPLAGPRWAELLKVDPEQGRAQLPQMPEHLAQFGDDLPDQLRGQLNQLDPRLDGWVTSTV